MMMMMMRNSGTCLYTGHRILYRTCSIEHHTRICTAQLCWPTFACSSMGRSGTAVAGSISHLFLHSSIKHQIDSVCSYSTQKSRVPNSFQAHYATRGEPDSLVLTMSLCHKGSALPRYHASIHAACAA